MTTTKKAVKSPEEWDDDAFEGYWHDAFGMKYSKVIGDELKEVIVGLDLRKKDAISKLLVFYDKYKDKTGMNDLQKFENKIRRLGEWLMLDSQAGKREKDCNPDSDVETILDAITKKLSSTPVEKLIDKASFQRHQELTGEYPSPKSILELFRYQAFHEPRDYMLTHIKYTRYKTSIKFFASLRAHMIIILHTMLTSKINTG